MKRILFFLAFFLSLAASAQTNKTDVRAARIIADQVFVPPLIDTILIPVRVGQMCVRPQDTTYWVGIKTTAGGKHWIPFKEWIGVIGGGSGSGITQLGNTGNLWNIRINDSTYAFDTATANAFYRSLFVPSSRTITINGTTKDLATNQTWTISGSGQPSRFDSSYTPLGGNRGSEYITKSVRFRVNNVTISPTQFGDSAAFWNFTVPTIYIDSFYRIPGKDSVFARYADGSVKAWKDSVGAGGGGGTPAIGDAITSATAGSVLFAGTGGRLQQKNTNFYYDSTNSRLGISTNGMNAFSGSSLPQAPFHIVESNSWQPRGAMIDNYGNFINGGGIMLRHARGTFASPATVLNGDNLGYIAFNGHNGTAFTSIASGHTAVFQAQSYSDFSSGVYATGFKFETTDSSNNITARVRITPSGRMSIGADFNPESGSSLDVYGNVTIRDGKLRHRTILSSNMDYYADFNPFLNVSTTQLNGGIVVYKSANNAWGIDMGHNSTTNKYRTRVFANASGDIALSSSTSATSQSSFTDWLVVNGTTGNTGIGVLDPLGKLHLAAGTTTTPPVLLTSGTPTTTPVAGAIQYNSGLFIIDSSTSKRDTIATRSWVRANASSGGGGTVYVDSVSSNITGDSLIVYKNGVRSAYLYPSGSSVGWGLNGNAMAGGWTEGNFIGLTNNRSLLIRTNNILRARIDSAGAAGIFRLYPATRTDSYLDFGTSSNNWTLASGGILFQTSSATSVVSNGVNTATFYNGGFTVGSVNGASGTRLQIDNASSTISAIRLTGTTKKTTAADGDITRDTNGLYYGKSTTWNEILMTALVSNVSPTAPNRTVAIVVGGETIYLHGKTTND